MSATLVQFDPLRDSRHRDAKAARDQADWLAWLELGGLRPRTLDSYERATAVCLRMFKNKEFAEITDGDLGHVFKTFPPASRRVRVAAYRSWFRWGIQTRRIDKNPMDYLPVVRRTPRKPIDTFTDTEQAALEALPEPNGTLMAILLRTGIRKGEARRLRARDLDLQRGLLRVLDGKGGKDRVVPLESALIVRIANFMIVEGVNRDDYLWHTRPGGGQHVSREKPIGEGSFARWWERALGSAGVRYMKPHTTRHTFATWWRRAGLDVDEIQVLLGHESIRTTSDLYVHTDVSDVAARMDAIIAARTPD